jgi:hypothetical protein
MFGNFLFFDVFPILPMSTEVSGLSAADAKTKRTAAQASLAKSPAIRNGSGISSGLT